MARLPVAPVTGGGGGGGVVDEPVSEPTSDDPHDNAEACRAAGGTWMPYTQACRGLPGDSPPDSPNDDDGDGRADNPGSDEPAESDDPRQRQPPRSLKLPSIAGLPGETVAVIGLALLVLLVVS